MHVNLNHTVDKTYTLNFIFTNISVEVPKNTVRFLSLIKISDLVKKSNASVRWLIRNNYDIVFVIIVIHNFS